MAPKILLTGVTGYIGGDAFYALHHAHPEFEYTLVVRNEDRAKLVREKYPDTEKVRIVYGTPSVSYENVLEEEASKTDIVLHTAESADHVPQAQAISAGLAKASGHSAENPAFFLHLGGTGILQWYDQAHQRYGQAPLPEEKYDDIASLSRLLTLPDSAMHRNVDKIVLATNDLSPPSILTAIVAPPTIYGFGRGPVNTTSMQVPRLARFVLEEGYAPVVGPPGLTEWDHVHISDVSSLFQALVEAAAQGRRDEDLFGGKAYYFCEAGAHVWGDVAADVAREAVAQGYLKEVVTKTVGIADVPDKSWGANSKSVASRARKYLGWSPRGPALEDEIPGIVDFEAKRLGLKMKGAATA